MRTGGLGGLLTLFTALFLRNPTAVCLSDLPPTVTLTCDSYGVVVNWTSSHPQEFNLTLISDPGNHTYIPTWDTQYNISEYLQDWGYTSYIVEVKTEDGKTECSPLFSYNQFQTVNIVCNLTFPAVELIPGDHQLTAKFRNPFHLYRDTPALRNLRPEDNLQFSISSADSALPDAKECPEKPIPCTQKPDMCEGTVAFPEEQEEYCVTVSGCIRQTYVQRTGPICYRGSLKPRVPISTYIVPLCVLLGIVLISVVLMFLAKKINKIIKEKIRSNLPECLEETSYTPTFTILKPGRELLVKNPLVEPVTLIPINLDPPANSCQPWGSCGCLIDFEDDPEEKSVCGELEEEAVQEEAGQEEDVPNGGLLAGYDMPHGLVDRRDELSPGDIVNTYGK